jgi:hypothetical protein
VKSSDNLYPVDADDALDALSAVGDPIAGPGGVAPAIEPTPDANAQTRFLNFAGRRVAAPGG